jgi:endonuclease/exonuclease/phosphatase family metal-dependent hydrolase
MPALRLIAWNCHHGSLTTRLAELARYSPDIVFLQECTAENPVAGQFVTRCIGPRKSIALGSPRACYRLEKLDCAQNSGRGCIAGAVAGPVSFTVLGIWSQGPRYVDDALRSLDDYADVLRQGPTVVMGDLNSGTRLRRRKLPSNGHRRIIGALTDLGLVSAYHAFHQVDHGRERHATYCHQFNAVQPWHIDFCFVPASWVECVVGVKVLAGTHWAKRSDHFPLMVDLLLAETRSRVTSPHHTE